MLARFDLAGFLAPFAIYAAILILHVALPARTVDGYVCEPKTDRPLRYRLNGLSVLFAAVFAWVVVGWLGWLPFDWLWHHRVAGLAGACTLGLCFTLWIVLPAAPTEPPAAPRAEHRRARRRTANEHEHHLRHRPRGP